MLDECHGHSHSIQWDNKTVDMYHYHLNNEYPYSIGCFRGTPAKIDASKSSQGQVTVESFGGVDADPAAAPATDALAPAPIVGPVPTPNSGASSISYTLSAAKAACLVIVAQMIG